ncbi:hypothetical protein WICMUC_000819 [Wickerhamomyces mucosus]|uniref:Uncharacterized protein n=1 Tax=Wickerhamomyces mucosus TaxID=1378264 RepID=A0A9P8PYP4_9ASCO|nr:hypothetical protein WICMUC_000819 [Wickerhamomyces mucosus]
MLNKQEPKKLELEPQTKQSPVPKKKRKLHDDYIEPQPVKHEFFDPLIAKYFKQKINKTKPNVMLQDAKEIKKNPAPNKLEKLDNILLENIYRMFGITLFPLSDPFARARGIESELLGVRIEIYNKFKGIFETPYYLILKKNHKELWIGFKNTIPIFIDLKDEIGDGISNHQLLKVLHNIREQLVKSSFKRQFFNYLKEQNLINIVENDLMYSNIIVETSAQNSNFRINLNLSLNDIISSSVKNDTVLEEEELLRLDNFFKGDINELERKLKYIKSNY